MTAPDFPQTRLALRAWQLDRAAMIVRSVVVAGRKGSWVAKAMASPVGNWPHDKPLTATCALTAQKRKPRNGEKEHGPVPDEDCTCGIYAATDLDVIDHYLSRGAPILGIVELGGRIIPAEQGYRAVYARVAAILLIDEALTEPHKLLRELAGAYRVPAVVPHSADPEQYRELAGMTTLAAEAEAYLRQVEGGGAAA